MTTTTTTNEIAAKIVEDHSVTRAQAKAIVEAVFAAVTAAAVSNDETSLPGFGKFKVKHTPEREACNNPGTGATIKVGFRQEAGLHTRKSTERRIEQLSCSRQAASWGQLPCFSAP